MLFNRNIFSIFYVLVLLGAMYLTYSIYSSWLYTRQHFSDQLIYLNGIFSSSVTSTFDQQEIMLELLGRQLLKNQQYRNQQHSRKILDNALAQNQSIVGFGLANLDGQLLAASSNIDLSKMPNLRTNPTSRDTFIAAIGSERMVVGRTYYLDALQGWVIPVRKAIRDEQDRVIGIMIAGIQPTVLLPALKGLADHELSPQHLSTLVHDDWYKQGLFYYAYISGPLDIDVFKKVIEQPVPPEVVSSQEDSMRAATGFDFAALREYRGAITYFTDNPDGDNKLYSLGYLPKYRLWSFLSLPKQVMTESLLDQIRYQVIFFIGAYLLLYYLFRHINLIQEKNRKQLIDQANHDFLTGLNNRQYLAEAESRWIFPGAADFTVLFVDLDNFKNINDSYGHSFGDQILVEVSRRLQQLFTSEQLVCRQSGDEFIILAPQSTIDDVEMLAERLLKTLSAPYRVEHYHFTIGASVGIACYPRDGEDFESLFSAADTAMYRAKEKRNSYFIFTDELHQQSLFDSQIEQAFHEALQNHEFYLQYQPQLSADRSLYGLEALVRWDSPTLGKLPPGRFIKIAEDGGMIIPLGEFIIQQAIADFAKLRDLTACSCCKISINVSVRQLQAEQFVESVLRALRDHRVEARQITLEITESIFIEDYEYLMPVLDRLRSIGCRFSLDDFGTGYSSLSMLRNLPIDELKIDKSFTDQLVESSEDRMMVLNIINIAKNLGLDVIAEGTETEKQRALLCELGCDAQQGYLFARPMDIDEVEGFLVAEQSPEAMHQ